MTHKTLVEVSVRDRNGTMIPYGIMNSEQAAELPADYEIAVAHPARDRETETREQSAKTLAC